MYQFTAIAVWVFAVLGIRIKAHGLEHIIKDQTVIYASKHQSYLDSIIIVYLIGLATPFVTKKDAYKEPMLKFYYNKLGHIGINRNTPTSDLRAMYKGFKTLIKKNLPLVIFSEGTRKLVAEKPDYKTGVYLLYKKFNVPVVPVALNSGLVLPKGNFLISLGVCTIEALPVIKPGLGREKFFELLQNSVEGKTKQLVTGEVNRREKLFLIDFYSGTN